MRTGIVSSSSLLVLIAGVVACGTPAARPVSQPTLPVAKPIVERAAPVVVESIEIPAEATPTVEKSALRVLYVGHDPENPQVMFADTAKPRTRQLYAERTPAFSAFLREYFESVTVVHAADYTVAMSDAVDVTIFDARPTPMEPAERGTDASGNPTYAPARFLPDSFDRPALLVAENSPTIGEALGLKLDWL